MELVCYCLLSMLASLLSLFVKYSNKYCDIIIMLLISSIFGLFSCGLPYENSDRFNYSVMFYNGTNGYIKTLDQILTENNLEVIYSIFIWGVRQICDLPEMFFFAISFISILCFLVSIYLLRYKFYLYVFLLSSSWYIFLSIYSCRQMLAAGVICIAYSMYMKNNEFLSFVFATVASLIHSTALVFFIYLFFSKVVNTKYKHITLFILMVSMSFIGLTIIELIFSYLPYASPSITRYFDSSYDRGIAIFIKGTPYLLLSIYSIYKYSTFKLNVKNIDILLISTCFGFCSFIAATDMYWLYRISFYSIFPSVLLIGQVLSRSIRGRYIEPVTTFIYLLNISIFFREMFLFYSKIL